MARQQVNVARASSASAVDVGQQDESREALEHASMMPWAACGSQRGFVERA